MLRLPFIGGTVMSLAKCRFGRATTPDLTSQRMTRERQLMLIGLVALICLGFAWAADDGVFATVFAIEVAVAAWGFEESKGG
jgi:hypothetical protein